ncbi:MAG: HEAT repeat domain-containing protein, partial [Solirubrobacteraceae bacterium]
LAGRLGASSAVVPLRDLAGDPDPVLRLAAATALARIPAAAPDDLLAFLGDAAAAVRRRAVVGLRRRHGLDPERAALLLGDPARAICKLASAALADSGPAARPAALGILRKFGSPARGLAHRAILCWRLRAWLRKH